MKQEFTKEEKEQIKTEAMELGIPTVGISYEKIVAMIDDKKIDSKEEVSTPKKSTEPSKNEVEDVTDAVVMDGKNVVRTYTLENHGDGFKKLAMEFATKRNYKIELKSMRPAIICPHCSGKIYQSK